MKSQEQSKNSSPVLIESHPAYPIQIFHDGSSNEYPVTIGTIEIGVALTMPEADRMMDAAARALQWERNRYGDVDPVEVSQALKQCQQDFNAGGASKKGIARLVSCFAE